MNPELKETTMVIKHIYSIPEFLTATGLGRTKAYELFATQTVKTCTIGRRRFVSAAALDQFVRELERQAEDRLR
jgi:hypothetical protein